MPKEICVGDIKEIWYEQMSKYENGVSIDETYYKQLIGSLMYLTATMFVTCLLSRYMSRPMKLHLQVAKRALRYLSGTTNYGIHYKKRQDSKLLTFTDSDYAGDLDDMKSMSGYVFLLSSGAVSWCSDKEPIVTPSTTGVEFVAAGVCACQAVWMRRILKELGCFNRDCISIKCDNTSTLKVV